MTIENKVDPLDRFGLGFMLTTHVVGNFEGEVLKVEFKDGSDPIYMQYQFGDYGGWFPATGSKQEEAIAQWEKQVGGAYKKDDGSVRGYQVLELPRRPNII